MCVSVSFEKNLAFQIFLSTSHLQEGVKGAETIGDKNDNGVYALDSLSGGPPNRELSVLIATHHPTATPL